MLTYALSHPYNDPYRWKKYIHFAVKVVLIHLAYGRGSGIVQIELIPGTQSIISERQSGAGIRQFRMMGWMKETGGIRDDGRVATPLSPATFTLPKRCSSNDSRITSIMTVLMPPARSSFLLKLCLIYAWDISRSPVVLLPGQRTKTVAAIAAAAVDPKRDTRTD